MGWSLFGQVPQAGRHRRQRDRLVREQLWSQPTIRRLEPRRVLNAAIQSLVVPATALEGDTILVSAEGTGDGVLEFDWTVSRDGELVATGDGSQFEFVATEDGQYTVDLLLTDLAVGDETSGEEPSDMASAQIAVSNVAPGDIIFDPVPTINENDEAELFLSFTDPGSLDVHTVTIDWGDGSANTITTLSVGQRDLVDTHRYLDDLPSLTSQDLHTITVTVADDDLGESTDSTSVLVKNVAPSDIVFDPVATINENEEAELFLSFTDSGTLDVHTVTIDWGDGSANTVTTLTVGQRDLVETHRYLDDNPTGTNQDTYTITVTVNDDDLGEATNSTSVQVNNVAPSDIIFDPVVMINENEEAELFLSFTDPGSLDVHTVTIDWGDGSANTVTTLSVGQRDLVELHRYRDDNPTATSQDTYTIDVTVNDDDGQEGAGSTTVHAKNIAPSDIIFDPVVMINENDEAELFLSFTDPGSLDVHTVTIDWGDGSANTVTTLPMGQRDLVELHHYLDDNPTATSQDTYAINVTVNDDDLGEATNSTSVLVKNDVPHELAIALSLANGENSTALPASGSTPGSGVIVPTGGDFTSGSIAGFKYEDLNGNGMRDAGLVQGDQPNVVYVIDISGSTGNQFEGSENIGDLNGDGSANTILDAQIAGFLALTDQLVALGFGETAEISIVAFSGSATLLDMDPIAAGDQLSVMANATSVETVLKGLRDQGSTNFADALSKAAMALEDLNTSPENGNVIFLSDGVPNSGAFTDEVAALAPLADNVRAFGVGSGASLTSLQIIDSEASIFTTTDELLDAFGGLNGGGSGGNFIEPGIPNVEVYLDLNDNGVLDSGEPVALTMVDNPATSEDEAGSYLFSDLPPDAYVVREVVPPGFMQTQPGGDGAYRVTLMDGEGLTNLNFGNQRGLMIFENEVVDLDLSFLDDGTLDQHTVTIDWGDGTIETVEVLPIGDRNGTFSHRYRDDDPTGTSQDNYTITVTVNDDDLGEVTSKTSVLVKNVAPSDIIFDPVVMINENEEAELFLSFTDPGSLDVHTVTIDWGDGSANTITTLSVGQRDLISTHRYLDDDPTATAQDNYTITVTVNDDDLGEVTSTTSVLVKNVAPSDIIFDPVTMINENEEAELFLSFTDPGSLDVHTVTIDWGDGSANTVTTLTVGQRDLVSTHRYLDDDPTATAQDNYTITVTVNDDDLAEATNSTSVLVKNVAPSEIIFDPVAMINENEEAELFLSFTDPGSLDVHTVTIDWGDGSANTITTLTVGQRDLVSTHRYLDDDPTATAQDNYTITVTVNDDDLGEATNSTSVLVKNVDPEILEFFQVDDDTPGGLTTLVVEVGDVGTDTFRYEVFWGDGTSFLSEAPVEVLTPEVPSGAGVFLAQQRLTLDHTYSADFFATLFDTNSVEGILRVFDDDLGFVDRTLDIEFEKTVVSNPGSTSVFFVFPVDEPAVARSNGLDAGSVALQADSLVVRINVPDVRALASELAASAESFLLLKVINPDGSEGQSFKMDAERLYDLKGFFGVLPDNDYEVWLINTETGVKRLVIGASVRKGRAVDPSDESDGGQEKPPGDMIPIELKEEDKPEELTPRLEPMPQAANSAEQLPASQDMLLPDSQPRRFGQGRNTAIAATGLAAVTTQGHWAKQVDQALAQADGNRWRRLRTARRLRSRPGTTNLPNAPTKAN